MRKVCQIIAAGGLIAGLAAPASATTITFTTPTNATTSGGAVDATATFTWGVTANILTIALDNLQANPTDVAQLLSDLSFTLSDPTLVSATMSSSYAKQVTIANNGSAALATTATTTAWQVSSLGLGSFHLDELCGKGNGCATPTELIIGPGNSSGIYSNGNGSINGNNAHNPFLSQEAVFNLNISGLGMGLNDTITGATFSFGTTSGINVEGLKLCPDCRPTTTSVVPEPASLVLLGSGLIGAAMRRRRTRLTAA